MQLDAQPRARPLRRESVSFFKSFLFFLGGGRVRANRGCIPGIGEIV